MEYKEKYEDELKKNRELSGKLSDALAENEALKERVKKIENNPLVKVTRPFRLTLRKVKRMWIKLKGCGSLKGVYVKVKYKLREKSVQKYYGTKGFPDENRRAYEATEGKKLSKQVRFSILVPLYNTPERFLREMITSVINQTYGNFELCLADGSDKEHGYVEKISKSYGDDRIIYKRLEKNGGIAENTNAALEMATGEYIALLDHDDVLHPSVLFEYAKAVNEQDADYLYCDEVTFKNKNIDDMITLHFKPDYAPDNLRANNYICHFSAFKRSLLEGEELFRTKFNGSQDHDMILRLTDKAERIVHIPRILYYWRSHSASVASDISAKPYAIQAAKDAVADHLRRHGFEDFSIESTRAYEVIFRIRYKVLGEPLISILIPNKDHVDDLKRCITSIINKSTYSNYEIIVIENNSETKEIKEYYETLSQYGEKIKVVNYEGAFNYSLVNNFGASYAKGDYVLLLNNDTEVITADWMEEMLMYAQREDVGAVGAKLYYPDNTIQHAGIILKMGAHRTAGHCHYKRDKEFLGYMGRLCYAQDFSAVTGACLMVKKSLWDKLEGLDKKFEISLNDIDFCLRLRELGLLNIFTPFAELYHYESVSRGLDDSGEKAERYNRESELFRNKWKEVLDKGDPYFNPNFSLDKSDFAINISK